MNRNNEEDFYIPDYMTKFKCIGRDCIDSCCTGFNIEIDKETYKNYLNSSEKKISLISKKYVVKKKITQIYHLLILRIKIIPVFSYLKTSYVMLIVY